MKMPRIRLVKVLSEALQQANEDGARQLKSSWQT
jgi:hypothetical protein